jgi:Initiator Replication protein
MDSPRPIRSLQTKSRNREALKPAELIQVTGHQNLSQSARKAITILWYHAHFQGVAEGKDYTIEIDELKPDSHKGYERVEEAIEALMKTLIIVRLPDGSKTRVQFLGGNNMDDPNRAGGVLTYSFDKRLIDILKDSTIWGKIALPVVMALTSKYAISLYENVAQMANLDKKAAHSWSLEDFRDLLGVQEGRYKTFGEFNKHVLKPVVAEVNALAPFGLSVLPVKQGKKVVRVTVGWWAKDASALNATWTELNGSKVGRKARINGTVEHVVNPVPSVDRMIRQARLDHTSPKTS